MQTQDTILATLGAAHAELCAGLAARLAGRVPPTRVVDLYARAMSMAPDEAGWLRRHVLRGRPVNSSPRYAGLLRFRDWMRIHAAPWNDPRLAAELEAEFARCRRVLAVLAARRVGSPSGDLSLAMIQGLPVQPALKAEARSEVLRRSVRRVCLPVAGLRLTAVRVPAAGR
jgi:hypothetical protein